MGSFTPEQEARIAKTVADARREDPVAFRKPPENVEPGSADKVWWDLNETVLKNEDVVAKDREEGKPNLRREAVLKEQKIQQAILRALINEKADDLTANEMYDRVQERIDFLEKVKADGVQIEDLLKAARDLQSKLIDEASRKRQ